MDMKQLFAPTVSNREYLERYDVLHRQVYASPPFDFATVTTHMYSPPPGYYTADHCLVHDGSMWHLYYVTGETKNFEKWAEAYYIKGDREAYKTYQYEVGDGHAAGASVDSLEFKNIILTEPQGEFDSSTRGNVHIVRHRDHWVALYQIRGPEGAAICAARSNNLYDWVPDRRNPVFLPPAWANPMYQCKDVHIVPWQGVYLVYYIVMGRDNLQTICLKVTENFEQFHEVGPVIKVPNMARGTRGIESPCIFERNGLWHLFFGWGINGVWHVVSDRPNTFVGVDMNGMTGSEDELDYGIYAFAPFHAAEIVEHQGEWFLTTTIKEELRRQDCDKGILKYRRTLGDELRLTHGLFKSDIRWDQDRPVCVKPSCPKLK